MWRFLMWVLLGALSLFGCSNPRYVQPDVVNIRIDSSVSSVHAQAFRDAAMQWSIATDGRLWVNYTNDAEIVFKYKVLPKGMDGQRVLPKRTESAAFIYIRPDLTDNVQATLLHELGHLWGLDHMPEGIMYWSNETTCLDALALREMAALRGLDHIAPDCQ